MLNLITIHQYINSIIRFIKLNHLILVIQLALIVILTLIIQMANNHFKTYKSSKAKTQNSSPSNSNNNFSLVNLVILIPPSNQTRFASNNINQIQFLHLLSGQHMYKLQTQVKIMLVPCIYHLNQPTLILLIFMRYLVNMRMVN